MMSENELKLLRRFRRARAYDVTANNNRDGWRRGRASERAVLRILVQHGYMEARGTLYRALRVHGLLTIKHAEDITARHQRGEGTNAIAERYGITPSYVSHIVSGKRKPQRGAS